MDWPQRSRPASSPYLLLGRDTTLDKSRIGEMSVYVERPLDVKRVIDYMTGASTLAAAIDSSRIGLYGFSRGYAQSRQERQAASRHEIEDDGNYDWQERMTALSATGATLVKVKARATVRHRINPVFSSFSLFSERTVP